MCLNSLEPMQVANYAWMPGIEFDTFAYRTSDWKLCPLAEWPLDIADINCPQIWWFKKCFGFWLIWHLTFQRNYVSCVSYRWQRVKKAGRIVQNKLHTLYGQNEISMASNNRPELDNHSADSKINVLAKHSQQSRREASQDCEIGESLGLKHSDKQQPTEHQNFSMQRNDCFEDGSQTFEETILNPTLPFAVKAIELPIMGKSVSLSRRTTPLSGWTKRIQDGKQDQIIWSITR